MTSHELVKERVKEIKSILTKEDQKYLDAYISSEINIYKEKQSLMTAFAKGVGEYCIPVLIIGVFIFLLVFMFRIIHAEDIEAKLTKEYQVKVESLEEEYSSKLKILEEREAVAKDRVSAIEEKCLNKIIN